MLAYRVQGQRNDGWPHDGREKPDDRKRVVRDRSRPEQRRTQRAEGADGEDQQHTPAIECLEENHADETSCRHQTPEPGDGARAGGVGIEAVILRQEF